MTKYCGKIIRIFMDFTENNFEFTMVRCKIFSHMFNNEYATVYISGYIFLYLYIIVNNCDW